MALNGVTEIILRWGVLGFIFFILAILRKRENKIRLFVIVVAFLMALGNIGQPLFWVLLSIIYLSHNRSNNNYSSDMSKNE